MDAPAEGLRGAYRQRRRWARGGLAGGAPVVGAYAALWLVHALPIAALVVAPGWAMGAVAVKAAADGALLHAVLRRVGGRLRARDLAGLEAFQFAYLTTLPAALALAPRIGWKGRSH